MGGKVAMHFALDNPSKVEKLIVADISPVTYITYQHAFLLDVMSKLDFESFTTKKELEREMLIQVPDKRLVNFMMKNVRNISREKFAWKLNIESLTLNLEEVSKFEPTEKQYLGKVLWLKGELSNYIQTTHHAQMYSLFPETLLKTIPNATHWLHSDNPDAFVKEIVDWV